MIDNVLAGLAILPWIFGWVSLFNLEVGIAFKGNNEWWRFPLAMTLVIPSVLIAVVGGILLGAYALTGFTK